MAYTKTIWENSPSENTPLSAENLNKIENGLFDQDARITTAEGEINNVEAVIGNETDTYSASSTYALGSLVIYNNLLYKCTTAIKVAEAWNSAKWTQASLTSLIQSNIAYSTTEQIIGKWIDGKPIYRKVITGVHNDAEVLVSNVDTLIKTYGQGDNITNQIRLIPWVEIFDNKNYTITVYKASGNNVYLKSQAQDISKPTSNTTKIVIEYTKTTD